jgi:hypothetical protein
MYRVSATQLEQFRLFVTDDWMTEQSLLDSLTGVFVPTPAVQLGHAYHAVLEAPTPYRVPGGYACEGFTFDDATMDPMLSLIDRRGVFEVKTTQPFGDVTLVAQADQLVGAHLYEFKTTGSPFSIDKYLDSIQWRVYALVFDPLAITYRVATLDDHGNGVVTLKDLNHLTLYPYAGIEQEVRSLVTRFVEFIRAKGLDELFRARQIAAEAVA